MFLLVTFIVACQTQQPTAKLLTGNLPLSAPNTIVSGDSLHVVVGPVSSAEGKSVGLVAVGSHGPYTYMTTFDHDGFAYFTIPAEHTSQVGYLSLIATADNARAEISVELQVTVSPSAYYVPTWVYDVRSQPAIEMMAAI